MYYVNVPKYLQFLNFLNFGEDTKRLVGLRLARAAGKKQYEYIEDQIYASFGLYFKQF